MKKIVLALAMCVWAWTADAKQISELQEWSNGTYWVLYDDGSKEQVSENRYVELLSDWIREAYCAE